MKLKTNIKGTTVRGRAAFTLPEVAIASTVFFLIAASLYTGIAHGLSLVDAARQELRATQIMLDKIEVVRLYTWTQLDTPGFVPANFIEYYLPNNGRVIPPDGKGGGKTKPGDTAADVGVLYQGTIKVSNANVPGQYKDTMKKVEISVTWTNGNTAITRQMETFISRHGVQNYIYY